MERLSHSQGNAEIQGLLPVLTVLTQGVIWGGTALRGTIFPASAPVKAQTRCESQLGTSVISHEAELPRSVAYRKHRANR